MRLRILPILLLILTCAFLGGAPCQGSDLALIGAKIYLSPTEPPIENGSILMRQGKNPPALDVKAFSNVRYVIRSGKLIFQQGNKNSGRLVVT